MIPPDCPPLEMLHRFFEGNLSDQQAEVTGSHLDICSQCQETVGNFTAHPLPKGNSTLPFTEEEGWERAAFKIRQLISDQPKNPLEATITKSPLPVRLRNYELLKVIGTGGMGVVYLARHCKLDRLVAVKVLANEQMQDEEVVRRFHREMKAVGQLDHPNIVRALDADTVDDIHFLVMEYIPGIDLSRLVAQFGALPIPAACEVIRQAALGLDHAHSRGLIHRDIKPSNIVLAETEEGEYQVKVLDLGLSQLTNQQSPDELTREGQMMGTLEYMAPEQGEDSGQVDIRADIYSLGSTLYKLLCAETPFPRSRYNSHIKLLRAIATETPPSILEKRSVPKKLADLIDRMLARNPEARPATARQIEEALVPFAEGHDFSELLRQITVPTSTRGSLTTFRGGVGDSGQKSPSETRSRADVSTSGNITKPGPLATRTSISWLRLCLLVGAASILLAGITFLLPSKHGYVRVEILDPSIQVTINGEGRYLVKDMKSQFEIHPGKHTLHIHAGGTAFQTKEFTVTRNDTTALRVAFVSSEKLRVMDGENVLEEFNIAKVEQDTSPPEPAKPVTPKEPLHVNPRAVAESILRVGSAVRVVVDGKQWDLKPGDRVPPGSVKLTGITFIEGQIPSDLPQQLHHLTGLVAITLRHTNLDEPLLTALSKTRFIGLVLDKPSVLTKQQAVIIAQNSHLRRLFISGPFITAELLDAFSPLRDLELLNFYSADFNDETLSRVTQFTKLIQLDITGARVSEQAFLELAALSDLKDLYSSQPFNEGMKLSRLLPNCRITCKAEMGDELICLQGGKPLDSQKTSNHSSNLDQKVARSILKSGGEVEVISQNKRYFVESESRLPSSEIKLVRIKLTDNHVPPGLRDQLPKLTHLEIVVLAKTHLDESLLNAITMTPINELILENLPSPLTEQQAEKVAHLSNLRRLQFMGQFVSGELIERLSPLKKLEVLSLYGAKFDDETVMKLSHLSQLKVLDLSGANVTNKAFLHLAKLSRLTVIHTKMSSDQAQELSRLLSNCHITSIDGTTGRKVAFKGGKMMNADGMFDN